MNSSFSISKKYEFTILDIPPWATTKTSFLVASSFISSKKNRPVQQLLGKIRLLDSNRQIFPFAFYRFLDV